MKKYALRKIGVWNNDDDYLVLPRTPGFGEYQRWLAAGNEPDPLPPAVPPPPPTPEEIAARAERDTRRQILQTLRANTLIQQLAKRTPADVDAWINTNVTDLASAKVVLRILAYVVALLIRERL